MDDDDPRLSKISLLLSVCIASVCSCSSSSMYWWVVDVLGGRHLLLYVLYE